MSNLSTLGHATRWRPGPASYNKGCRCEACTELHRRRHERWVTAAKATPEPDIPHGLTGYVNWRCRCETCKHAGSLKNALAKARRNRDAGRALTALQAEALAWDEGVRA